MNLVYISRCAWLPLNKPDYIHYHDTEWGVPVYNDQRLFEMLILEGAQAGLSWYSVLKRRQGYTQAFHNFVPALCAHMSDEHLEHVLTNGDIIRNRLKVSSVRRNAQFFLQIQHEFGAFSNYLWRFVNDIPMVYHPATLSDMPATSTQSDALAQDLKKRGMSFVGSTIMYAYMQAVGMVNNHMINCFKAT